MGIRDRPYPVIALVGYTNAGKSTLFNKATNADVLAKDMLFATLDTTSVSYTHLDVYKRQCEWRIYSNRLRKYFHQ